MGKRNIFGRRSSKDRGSPTYSQGEGEGKKKKAMEEVRSEAGSQGQRAKSQADKRKETPKVDRRKTRDKAKQLSENKNSTRRMKKKEEVKSLVQRLPSEVKSSSRSSVTGGIYDSIMWEKEQERSQGNPVTGAEAEPDSDTESIYESRKLLIRQMQGQIAKQVHEGRDSVSEYDSWTDLEENFALAYEPIPLSIKMATWRKMTKREILRKVNSKKIRKDFEYLSHGEILDQIEKMQKNALYLKTKFGIGHLVPQPQQAHVVMVHRDSRHPDTHTAVEDSEGEDSVTESDGNISRASFVSGREIYLSRAEILSKIHEVPPKNNSNNPNKNKKVDSEKPKPQQKKASSLHDSWSSRASSILKDPEAIYVSRVELLKKIDVKEEARQRGGRKAQAGRVQHDSWSSRASSILAAVEAEQDTLRDDEPLYISRVELLEKLQLKSLATLSAASGTSAESDSDASTVKTGRQSGSPGQRKWKLQSIQFQKDLHSAKVVRSKAQGEGGNNNNYSAKSGHSQGKDGAASQDKAAPSVEEGVRKAGGEESRQSSNGSVEEDLAGSSETTGGKYEDEASVTVETVEEHSEERAGPGAGCIEGEDEFDSCSCVTCNTCHQSDCSCSDVSNSSQSSRSSHSSDGSIETVVGHDELNTRDRELGHRQNRKHSDIYIVNGSDVSNASSKASTKISKKSANYDPLPQNGITKVKHKKLSQTEIERERILSEREIRLRSFADSEERKHERHVKKPMSRSSKDSRGTVKSTKSWTNEEFGKLYEPVSATELKKQHQVKELKKQLQNLSPEWDKTVESISTMRRKKVLRQLKAVVTHNVDLDNISEEELGKHLDKALRQALDMNYEALSHLNLGAMYVPMEQNPANSKAVSRENTDYDTFGSIDSLIFEPKIPTEEDIEEVQEEITQSFEYLENEDDGQGKGNPTQRQFEILSPEDKRSPKYNTNAMAVGKTTFAERVRLFQSLGDKKTTAEEEDEFKESEITGVFPAARIVPQPQGKTTWKEQALQKEERTGRESAASATSHSTNSSGSTVIYNVTAAESAGKEARPLTTQGTAAFLEDAPSGDKPGGRRSSQGETWGEPSQCSACWSPSQTCDCWDQLEEEAGEEACSCEDCPECSQPTLRRFVETSATGKVRQGEAVRQPTPSGRRSSKSSPTQRSNRTPPTPRSKTPGPNNEAPVVLRDVDNLIPFVGNLRRQLRENFNKPSLNIEKKKQKKGFIEEDTDECVPRAPSVENISTISKTVQERIERADSFKKLQTRDQFRSVSPELEGSEEEGQEERRKAGKELGLVVEVQHGQPLLYDQQPQQTGLHCPDRETPNNKGSDMGDSGISSNPASLSPPGMSPNSTSSDSSSSTSPKSANNKEPVILKKLVPPGGKKRDTMIRELKFKLKERFPSDGWEAETADRRGEGAGSGEIDSDSLRSHRAEVGPKLSKIFGALMSEAGSGPGQATLLRQQRRGAEPSPRNLPPSKDDISTLRSSKLATVEESDYADSICPSIYDPSLPPGLEHHIALDSPPPPPPPTQNSSKLGSILSSSQDEASIPSRPPSTLADPLDRRELLYGPGGMFGPRGPFSTPGQSRYPEVPAPRKTQSHTARALTSETQPSAKSSSASITEESGLFDGDRSDKSQYICNPVMTMVGATDPFSSSRIENYRARVSPETPVELSEEQRAALSCPDPATVEKWVEEKQRRMISWVARGGQVRAHVT